MLLNTGMIMLGHLNSALLTVYQDKKKKKPRQRKITEFKVYNISLTIPIIQAKFARTKKKERETQSQQKEAAQRNQTLNDLDFRINKDFKASIIYTFKYFRKMWS